MKTIQLISEFWLDGDDAYDGIRIVVANNGETIFQKKYYFDLIDGDDPYGYCRSIVRSMAKDLRAKILPETVQHLGEPLWSARETIKSCSDET